MRGHVRRRGRNAWAAIIYLGRDASGKDRYKWYAHPTRRDAEAHLNALMAQVGMGASPPPTRLRLDAYLQQWLDAMGSHVRPTTLRIYRYAVEHYIVPTLGPLPLLRLTPPAVEEWLGRMHKRGLSKATAHQAQRVLREALGQAVRWGMLPRSPMAMVRVRRVPHRAMHVWDEEQVRLFLAEARRSSNHYTLYLMAILTGMRQGELFGLRWQDIDWTFERASVRQTLVRLRGTATFSEPKSQRSRRSIPLPPVLLDELRRLKDRQAESRRVYGRAYADHDLVFSQPTGKPLHGHNITQRDFRRVITRAGVPHIRFHDLRHASATLLLRQGTHPKVVQERLGHSGISVTMDIYSHVLPGMQEEAATLLARRLVLGEGDPAICRHLQNEAGPDEPPRGTP
jgi:integrase